MDPERIERMVTALRVRGVMAHRADAGVYEFGIGVALGDGSEAQWNLGGAAGLDAVVTRDGVLVGFLPHVLGGAAFTDDQIVDAIATARYPEEGLYPARDDPARDAEPRPDSPAPPGPPAPADPRPSSAKDVPTARRGTLLARLRRLRRVQRLRRASR
ncbi:hypothetical protein [Streptomyces sp. CBMA29]|uniref:hypothetical protein n=1 Tax=Streptomyces sp. CBMA29 TaxID=1896314 RepID=UPI001661919E|nr:hypothetical protein [Streptomyces sp. CBMA29]MBD0734726.1 hypothetical protein [Streptomyces sp. CBMA29]